VGGRGQVGLREKWLCFSYTPDMIAWATGTNEFLLRGGTQRTTGVQSLIRASSIIAIKGKDFIVRNFDQVPTLTKEMPLARDRYVCACARGFSSISSIWNTFCELNEVRQHEPGARSKDRAPPFIHTN
jgi:hypothetical protein